MPRATSASPFSIRAHTWWPGRRYSADGRSFMPDNFSTLLTAEQIDQLVAYLATLP